MIGCPFALRRFEKSPFRHSGSGTVSVETGARLLPQAFVVDEEERLVGAVVAGKHHRPAEVAAELVPLEAAFLLTRAIGEEVRGVELAVPPEAESRRVKLVAAALRDEVDDATAEPPELGADGVGLDAELLHGVDRWRVVQVEDRDVVLGVHVRDAVDRDFARRVTAAADER